jgi:PTS system N-acetylgalactosamine-specific IIA component
MKKIIVISGHGHFAAGIQSSIELLAGKNEDVCFIDFLVNDTDVTLKEKFNILLNQNPDSQVLFVCDIFGGTPFKTAAELWKDNENIEVVAGCNVGSIIQAIFQRDSVSLGQIAENIINSSKRSTIRLNKADLNEKFCSSPDMEDGI